MKQIASFVEVDFIAESESRHSSTDLPSDCKFACHAMVEAQRSVDALDMQCFTTTMFLKRNDKEPTNMKR
jgi:hypothetical protein